MSAFQVLTFADKPLTDQHYLKQSCEEHQVPLEVLISSPWIQNVIKLKLLYDYVQKAEEDLTLLVVDAYDVVLYGNSQEILSAFDSYDADIVFSGEANFMYKEPGKWLSFLRKYPRQKTIFQYLNSGSYMGRVKDIRRMLEEMQVLFNIDLTDESKLLPIRSDQYLLSRFYVERSSSTADLKMAIDADHRLLGVTGGRFCVLKTPDLGRWQAFVFFILERNLLKLFRLHQHQKVPRDYQPKEGRFFNTKTQSAPPVMHFPGTWDRFDKVYEDLRAQVKPGRTGTWMLAALVSLLSFPLSILAAPLFWILTRR